MTLIRKILISLFIILIFSFLTTVAIYISLIYKPDNIIFFANKYLNDDYIIEYDSAVSDKDLLSPGFNFEAILVKDSNSKIILEADKIRIGINLVKTVAERQINLTFLDLENFLYINNKNTNYKTNLKLFITTKISFK